MFAQLVMLSSIALLLLAGGKTFWQSRRINYPSGEILAFGLFFVALGILGYAIRDILIQFEEYQLELVIGKIGIFFHVLGGVLILRFLTQSFTPQPFKQIFFAVCFLYLVIVPVALAAFPVVSEIMVAPFEPFPYKVIRHTPVGMPASLVIFLFVIGPLLLAAVVGYNIFKLEEKKLKTKALLYGMSFLLLFIPSLVCLFISPVYARWGYLIGAILLYKVLRMKV